MTDLLPLGRLDKDLRAASKALSTEEVRWLVSEYYTMQNNRIRSANQVRARGAEPHEMVKYLAEANETLEGHIKTSLDVFTANDPVGQWMRRQIGIGPVIAAGFLAHIDITRAPTAGHIWSYAGLIDGMVWLGGAAAEKAVAAFVKPNEPVTPADILSIAASLGCHPQWLARRVVNAATGIPVPFREAEAPIPAETCVENALRGIDARKTHVLQALSKRPWNADLKTLCWKLGESFVKTSGNEKSFYGKIYVERKALETAKNAQGDYASQAERSLKKRNFRKETDAFAAYSVGQLPKAHIHARAKRFAVKMFLSHLHHVMYVEHFKKEPPQPYAIGILNHVDYIAPPP